MDAPGTARSPLVGRERELALLDDRLAAAGRGEGRLVLVAGEPGIGKTRLIAELGAQATAAGWAVLAGRAYDQEGLPPYLPIIEALRGAVREAQPEALRALLGAGATEVALLLPDLHRLLPDLPPSPALPAEQARYRLIEAVCGFVLALARAPDRPGLLLTLDDLHWADAPTLLLLGHLARRLADAPLLVAGAYRTVDLARTHPLAAVLADLRREGLSERLLLAPLAADAAAAFVAAHAAAPPAPAIAATLLAETGGNPFFLGELVAELRAEGRDLSDPGALVVQWGIPEGVREVIGRRLSRLSDAANRLLPAAAVLGDGVTFEVLEAVTELPFDALTDALDEAVTAGFVREAGGAYSFGHALIRQAVAAELSLPRRQRLHLRAADAIERLHARNLEPHLGVLAGHLRLAGAAADPEKALAYAIRAAERAERVFAWEDALAHRQAALESEEDLREQDGGRAYDLLIDLGHAQRRVGSPDAAVDTFRRAFDVARALGDAERLARAALDLEDARWEGGLPTVVGVEPLGAALRALGEGDSILRARVMARFARSGLLVGGLPPRAGEPDAWRLGRDALAMARRLGDPATLAVALHAQLEIPEPAGRTTAERLALAADLVAQCERENVGELASRGHHHLLTVLLQLGDMAGADEQFAAHARLAARLGVPWYATFTLLYRGARALLAGRLDEAEELAARAIDEAQRLRSTNILGWALDLLAVVLHLRGRDSELRVRPTIPGQPPAPSGFELYPLYPASGREADVDAAAEEAWAFPSTGRMDRLGIRARLAEICAAVGDTRRAVELYDQLLPSAALYATLGPVVCLGAIPHYLGLLAMSLQRREEAAEHFEHALAMNERVGARPFLARTALAYAELLLAGRRRGDAARARALLMQVAAICETLGMAPDLARAGALLTDPAVAKAATGAAPHPDGLSEREVEVLRLLAAGKSNAEIAEALVISVHTVIRHANHIFAKLGVQNRVEAAAYAHRTGLV